ncbi:nicotinate-nucleotide diphosphorylase (carboxylating) [Fusobacterium sp. OBRC1]|nr:nicotinate-nucleotide diphosphorylase (carboxylating) [Fusobacterium sp. OBRC1]
MRKIDKFQMDESIKLALKEDITSEDISTNAIYKNDRLAEVSLYSKEDGILAGLDVFKRVFELLDNSVEFTEYKKDGDKLLNKDLILKIRADIKTILSAERTALNYLQRMSGIATYTQKMMEALDDKNIKLLDTRKTTPNMRIFEKYAVRVGGGYNHRYNLSDAIMLKDNHINAAGSITEAIKLAREYSPFIKKIEIEVEDLKGVEEAVRAGADIIMLDNMDIETIKKAIKIINKQAIIECSGNVDITNINRFKGLEIDYISSGAITHSAKILDLSLKNLRYTDD